MPSMAHTMRCTTVRANTAKRAIYCNTCWSCSCSKNPYYILQFHEQYVATIFSTALLLADWIYLARSVVRVNFYWLVYMAFSSNPKYVECIMHWKLLFKKSTLCELKVVTLFFIFQREFSTPAIKSSILSSAYVRSIQKDYFLALICIFQENDHDKTMYSGMASLTLDKFWRSLTWCRMESGNRSIQVSLT